MIINTIPYYDLTALVFSILAIIQILRSKALKTYYVTTVLLIIAIFVFMLAQVSNVLDYFNITNRFDIYEDYLEVLFIPILLFAFYSYAINIQLIKIKKAEDKSNKKSARLQYVMEGSKSGYWDWDIISKQFYLSPEYFQITGQECNQNSHSSKFLMNIVHPQYFKTAKDYFGGFKEYNDNTKSVELKITHSDNSNKWVLLKGKSIKKAPDGKSTRVCGIIIDITFYKEIQDELYQAKEKALESEKLKSAFISNLSHEIRTPMNSVIGFLGLIQNNQLSNEKRDYYFDIVKKSSVQLLNFIDDIIDISKIDIGQLELNIQIVNIDSVLQELFKAYIYQAKDGNNEFLLNLPEHIKPVEIYTDSERLKQITSNLLNNANKFTKNGIIELGYDLNDDYVVFYVKDTGIGIDEEDADKIFDRFYKSHDGDDSYYTGTGLGLSITKALVNVLGGKIWMKSKSGKGSTFYFSLPVDNQIVFDSNEYSKKDDDDYNFKGKSILIVEDDHNSYLYLKEIIEPTGAEIYWELDGEGAIEFCTITDEINLVLMDIQLPRINGFDATKKIKKINKSIPVVTQTAYTSGNEKEIAVNAGCDDMLIKPIDKQQLLKKIKAWIT